MADTIIRRKTPSVFIGNVAVGSKYPIVIQSMTNTPTTNVTQTVRQCRDLVRAGAEIVRITINNEKAAQSAVRIIRTLKKEGCCAPIIGDFHYNGHLLLTNFPKLAALLDKYRINPGNIGNKNTALKNFATVIKLAIKNDKPIRIGVNSGSLDPFLLQKLGQANSRRKQPKSFNEIVIEAMVQSALQSAQYARKLGLNKNKIILSVKMSDLQDTIRAYQQLASQCDYALHLGLTEAGSQLQGIVASTATLAILLEKGIGDTIRVSLTPQPGFPRSYEVYVCKEILQALNLRFYTPKIISCPGCGRTKSNDYQILTKEVQDYVQKNIPHWKKHYPGVEKLTIAVMGCIVNGPGESRSADIGISLPGHSENPEAVVFAAGQKLMALKGPNIKNQFFKILRNYIQQKYS